ncbi:MAG: phosphohexomutase domain-containing protein [Armatimonadota bacterium]
MEAVKSSESIINLLKNALENRSLVQSFSGVRTRFGEGPGISEEHEILAHAYGFAYARRTLIGMQKATLVVGRDPRPTGETLASALARGFLAGASSLSVKVRILDLGIITTPLIETAVRALKANGGVMVTASHNPLTDNGFKFLTGVHAVDAPDQAPPGALLSAPSMGAVVDDVRQISVGMIREFTASMQSIDDESFRKVFGTGEDQGQRVKAERAYLDFLGREWGVQPHCLKPLVLGPALLDPNGGAACGIGARVLEHFGVRAIEVNAEIGYPEHAIDTDGTDPASGRHMLLRVSRAALRHGARFGIAFDYDADRGNIVLAGLDESAIIKPQTVATMNVALALAHREISGRRKNGKLAIVISEATSGSCDKVAALFGAEVFTVETGEINVVTRMHQLRSEGYDVPVGVEGANGGSIFGEATCRDGLQTSLCAALADEQPALAKQWVRVLHRNGDHSADGEILRLPEILEGMPSNFNRMLRIEGPDKSHAEIKSRMEEHFASKLWPTLSSKFDSYSFANYEGTQEVDNRTGDETGGWRLILHDGDDSAFIFARGSRTESGVWRMIVDDPETARGASLIHTAVDMMNAATDGQAILKK